MIVIGKSESELEVPDTGDEKTTKLGGYMSTISLPSRHSGEWGGG